MNLAEIDEKQMLCKHGNFHTTVHIAVMESGKRMADITINCTDCGIPFHFKGLECGIDLHGARVSPDATEGRFAIAPGHGGILSKQE